MALTERAAIGKIEILENGVIQLRVDDVIERDGVEINRLFSRKTLAPGDDLTGMPPRVVAIANLIWTPAVIAAYRAMIAANRSI